MLTENAMKQPLQVAAAFDLPIKPNMDDYYDPSFLPPLEMRQIPQAVKDRLK